LIYEKEDPKNDGDANDADDKIPAKTPRDGHLLEGRKPEDLQKEK
jgi:hypothetical protein